MITAGVILMAFGSIQSKESLVQKYGREFDRRMNEILISAGATLIVIGINL